MAAIQSGNSNGMSNIEKSLKKLEFINQWISNCDTKSSFILTFYGVIITIIFTSSFGTEMINTFSYQKANDIDFESIKLFFSMISVFLFFIAIVITICFIYMTLKGRIDPKIYAQRNLNTDSNVFFGSIASKKFVDFESQNNSENEEVFLNDINSQVFINSNIVSLKFKHYNSSLKWVLITFGIFLFYAITK